MQGDHLVIDLLMKTKNNALQKKTILSLIMNQDQCPECYFKKYLTHKGKKKKTENIELVKDADNKNNFKWPGIKKQKCLRNYDKSIQRSKGKYGKIF